MQTAVERLSDPASDIWCLRQDRRGVWRSRQQSVTCVTVSETSALQDEVEKLRAQVQSDQRERGFLEQRIEDLKERAERAERKEDQLHALLVDQRPQATVEPRKGFWGRLFG